MQDYMDYNFEHNPSIVSEYVNFLVIDRASFDTNSGLEERINWLESKIDDMGQVAKKEKLKAATATNGLVQFKVKVASFDNA